MSERKCKTKNKPKQTESDLSNKLNKSDKWYLPDDKSVVSKEIFISPKGKKYQIIETDQKDEYEEEET